MKKLNINDIKSKLNEENIIGEGKEAIVYDDSDRVIKILKENRTSPFETMSIEGLERLSELDLKHFNTPIDLIFEGGELKGYTEKKLEIKDIESLSMQVLDELKYDVNVLSMNGYKMNDILYNYTSDNNFQFYDLTSYTYTNTNSDYLKNFYYQKNIFEINKFLVGVLKFGAYKHGEGYELTKSYKAIEYINENVKDQYYGDYIKNENKHSLF